MTIATIGEAVADLPGTAADVSGRAADFTLFTGLG